jgi:hypothetical protein
MTTPTIVFEDLASADLIVDAVYEGGANSQSVTSDPIHRLLPVHNQGGFRFKGSVSPFDVRLVVLYTSGHNPDWPDFLDPHTGRFVYFGDNKTPGSELHETSRKGNQILKAAFDAARDPDQYVPPFFLFEKTGERRNVRFRGLAVPGNPHLSADSDLVAIWRTTKGERFQNYRAVFTVLDVGTISREWINDIDAGTPDSENCPVPWFEWSLHRHYTPLEAPRTITHRSPTEQLPEDSEGMAMLRTIHEYFSDVPTAFEECAVAIWRMIEPSVQDVTITQASRDGGRDAVGRHALGPQGDRVVDDFALEAKCYDPGNTGVGVKDVSRLISRLLHRQYGVLVTTSYVGAQPYKEIREDGHPVVIVAGIDVVEALRSAGMPTAASVEAWLLREFKL